MPPESHGAGGRFGPDVYAAWRDSSLGEITEALEHRLILDLAAYRAQDAECGIEKLHFYPFGGLQKTAEWVNAVVSGRFAFEERGIGLVVGDAARARVAS